MKRRIDASWYLINMIKEARLTGDWIEIKGKLYAAEEVEEKIGRFEDVDTEFIKLKDPLMVLQKADRLIEVKIKNMRDRREAFVTRLKKYGAIKPGQ